MAKINTYALAVEIDNDLFEIFHLINTEENSDMDIRYRENTKKETKAVSVKKTDQINLGAFWDGESFIPNPNQDIVPIDEFSDAYAFLAENTIFGILRVSSNDPFIEKYRAAIESNVIIINLSEYDDVNLGEIWNRKELYSIEGIKK